MTYHLEIRSQHAKGTWPHQGPDTYVAVQCVPCGSTSLTVLNHTAATKRGIILKFFGGGYSRHCGPRSALGKAIAAAQAFIDNQEEEQSA